MVTSFTASCGARVSRLRRVRCAAFSATRDEPCPDTLRLPPSAHRASDCAMLRHGRFAWCVGSGCRKQQVARQHVATSLYGIFGIATFTGNVLQDVSHCHGLTVAAAAATATIAIIAVTAATFMSWCRMQVVHKRGSLHGGGHQHDLRHLRLLPRCPGLLQRASASCNKSESTERSCTSSITMCMNCDICRRRMAAACTVPPSSMRKAPSCKRSAASCGDLRSPR